MRHGACDHLRPGRLRASHAVCLRYSTLEPANSARKEADHENLSTTESNIAESLLMQGDLLDISSVLFGFSSTSRHCIPLLSPRNSNPNELTANNGAAANRSGCHGSCDSGSGPSRSVVALSYVRRLPLRSTLAATAPAYAVSELSVVSRPKRTPTRRPTKETPLATLTLTRRLQ